MKTRLILAISGLALLAGCGNQGDKAPGIPVGPKWKGLAYRLTLDAKTPDAKAPKPNPSGVTLPAVQFTANPEALERRAILIVRYDSSGVKSDKLIINQIIVGPFDISGETGGVPNDYIELADKNLATLLQTYCVKGKVKVSVALARSSLSPQAGDPEIEQKRLSDWTTTEIVFKNPKKGC